jgi:hypothetical protein
MEHYCPHLGGGGGESGSKTQVGTLAKNHRCDYEALLVRHGGV